MSDINTLKLSFYKINMCLDEMLSYFFPSVKKYLFDEMGYDFKEYKIALYFMNFKQI